jgi:outer membrane protein OmpA-like peptidoglycan-associated protein
MKRFLLPLLAIGAMALTAGCATKKDVSQKVTPVMNKLDDLDDRTAQTTRGIRDLDQRSQQGIRGVEGRAATADQRALAASRQAGEAQALAANVGDGVNGLSIQVANLDNYHPVSETAVLFGFNKAELTRRDKQQLDTLARKIPDVKGCIVEIEGRTDAVGNADYNYQLSKRRAAAVTQYLASEYNVPAHKIFIIGLGKDAPVEKNTSAHGRAENRRVDVRLMTNNVEAAGSDAQNGGQAGMPTQTSASANR